MTISWFRDSSLIKGLRRARGTTDTYASDDSFDLSEGSPYIQMRVDEEGNLNRHKHDGPRRRRQGRGETLS